VGAFERRNHFLPVPDMETAIPQSPTPWSSLCTDSSADTANSFVHGCVLVLAYVAGLRTAD
jgi:hypothetical protein